MTAELAAELLAGLAVVLLHGLAASLLGVVMLHGVAIRSHYTERTKCNLEPNCDAFRTALNEALRQPFRAC